MEPGQDSDESGPRNTSATRSIEKRIVKLEEAYIKISETLLPAVARLEVKVESTNQVIVQFKDDMNRFKDDLAAVQDGVEEETTGNLTRDIALKAIQENEVKKEDRRKKVFYGLAKVAITVLATLVSTLFLVWLDLK
jgi:hypothetical protein